MCDVINGCQLPVLLDSTMQCDDGRKSHPRAEPPQPSTLIILFSGDNYSDSGGDVDHYERRYVNMEVWRQYDVVVLGFGSYGAE